MPPPLAQGLDIISLPMKKTTVLLVGLMIALSSLSIKAGRLEEIRDSLNVALAQAINPTDSLKTFLNIYDVSPLKNRDHLIDIIYPLAVRTHNIDVQLEMISRKANISLNRPNVDSVLRRCQESAEALPKNEAQRSTLTFIKMIRAVAKSKFMTDSARREEFREEILSYRGDNNVDIDERIRHHFAVCQYIGNEGRSPLLASNIVYLGDRIRKLPYQMEAVRNLFLTQAARMYTILGDKKRAVSTDREMLRGMRAMENRYHNEGRIFRSYATATYSCLRRMLLNYPALASGEADSIYATIKKLVLTNGDVAAAVAADPTTEAFYLLAKGRYADALKLLRTIVDKHPDSYYRTIFLRELCNAARLTHDNATMIKYYPLYVESLETKFDKDRLAEMIQREVDYKVCDNERQKTQMDVELSGRLEKIHHYTIIGAIILTVVLLTLVILLYRMYSRANRLSRTLTQTNSALTRERDKLRRSERDLLTARDRITQAMTLKTDFINNISREVSAPLTTIVEYSQFIVDNMDEERKKYLKGFAEVVTLSAELIQTLINDVLDTSAIECGQFEINRRPIAVNDVCNMLVGNFSRQMKPGVKLIFDKPEGCDPIVTTDPQRVEQVLINLLNNAAKFTDTGSVTLSYCINSAENNITFSVTDTGIGIPAGKENVIFDRFEKLDNQAQGVGLGLYICSLLSKLLNGEVKVDTSYTDGARFLFTIPIS